MSEFREGFWFYSRYEPIRGILVKKCTEESKLKRIIDETG
jgi:hypothetical protein